MREHLLLSYSWQNLDAVTTRCLYEESSYFVTWTTNHMGKGSAEGPMNKWKSISRFYPQMYTLSPCHDLLWRGTRKGRPTYPIISLNQWLIWNMKILVHWGYQVWKELDVHFVFYEGDCYSKFYEGRSGPIYPIFISNLELLKLLEYSKFEDNPHLNYKSVGRY